ncbi:hypothetical protein niasHT_033888 [Heterodera trifolii]|uniref:Uncharacterized protein n=1 Tax=Heterodera trifolii TaxID=157864 RepID=A0ABD2I4A0_9BILA
MKTILRFQPNATTICFSPRLGLQITPPVRVSGSKTPENNGTPTGSAPATSAFGLRPNCSTKICNCTNNCTTIAPPNMTTSPPNLLRPLSNMSSHIPICVGALLFSPVSNVLGCRECRHYLFPKEPAGFCWMCPS